MKENKSYICDLLSDVLKETRNLWDLEELEFDQETEIVTAYFINGFTKKANVASDSGTAMIIDIIRQLV